MPGFDAVTGDHLPAPRIEKEQFAIMTYDQPTRSVDSMEPIKTDFYWNPI